MTADWFVGHTLNHVHVGEAVLRACHGGAGPPVLLLHGAYGESSKPPTTADHAPCSKRAMAGDCLH